MTAEIVTTAALAGIFYLVLRKVSLPTGSRARPASEKTELKLENKLTSLFKEGEAALREGKLGEAEQKFLEVKLSEPRFPRVDNRLGIVYLEKGENEKAVEAFEQAVREDPTKAARHANLAIAYSQIKKYSLAKKTLERALELAPENERYKRLLEELEKG